MQVKCEVLLELDTGNYELKVHNLSAEGEPIERQRLMKILERVFTDWNGEQQPPVANNV